METRKIEVIGPGCPKCAALEQSIHELVGRLGAACEVVKVSSMDEIIARGVMATPALSIDGKLVSAGRIPTRAELEKLLAPGGAP